MVKISDIEKDIRVISEKVGTAVFTYEEIHNKDVNTKYKYDYQKVIDEVSRLNGRDMTDELLDNGILSPLPDGEYKVNVGSSTSRGGGVNYWGTAFFSYSKKDYETHYHELAHSLQDYYRLFDDKMVDEMYEKSGNGLSEEDKNKKLADRVTYRHYLKEMHSEAFAYGAKMLRAENWWDFGYEAFKAYKVAVMRNVYGIKDKGKSYGGWNTASKYYASYPVMKDMIKQVYNIRKQKKLGEYFDENGVINDEKLARLSENVVKEKGYSPRTLKSYFDHKYFDEHKRDEHGWRRDTLKTLAIFIPLSFIKEEDRNALKERRNSFYKHYELVKDEKKMVNEFLDAPISKNKSPEDRALEAYQKIMIKLGNFDLIYGNLDLKVNTMSLLSNALDRGGIPNCYIDNKCNRVVEKDKKYQATKIRETRNTLNYVNKIIQENKDNPYFKALIDSNMSDIDVHKMIVKRKKNNDKSVIRLNVEKVKASGYKNFPVRFMLTQINNFCDTHKVDEKIKNECLQKLVDDPKAFESEEFRLELFRKIKPKNDFWGFKTRKKKQDFTKMMDAVSASYFGIADNDFALKALKGTDPKDMLNIVEERLKKEKAGYDELGEMERQLKNEELNDNAIKFDNKIKEAEKDVDFLEAKEWLEGIKNNIFISFEAKESFLNLVKESALEMKDCSCADNFSERNAYLGALIGEKLSNSNMLSDREKAELYESFECFVSNQAFYDAFSDTYSHDKNASDYRVPTKEERAIEQHLKFLSQKEELLNKYPEISNLEAVIDDSYRSAIANKKLQPNTFNIKQEGGLSNEFRRDWQFFNEMLRDCITVDEDNCLNKLVGKDKEETLSLKAIKKENSHNDIIPERNFSIEDDKEYKVLYEKMRYENLKNDMIEKYPDVINMKEIFDSVEKEIMEADKSNAQIGINYKLRSVLSDEEKRSIATDFENMICIAKAIREIGKDNPYYDKIKDLGGDALTNIYEEKRKNPYELLNDKIYENEKNKELKAEEPEIINEDVGEKTEVEESKSINEGIEEKTEIEVSSEAKEVIKNDKMKSIEELLIDDVIKKGGFSKDEEQSLLDIAVLVEKHRIENTNIDKTYSEIFMDKVIESDVISEENKNKLLKSAIKTENREIAQNEAGKRLYFDEDNIKRFKQLNLSDKVIEAMDIKLEEGKFSIKIPEDEDIRKEVINSIKVKNGIEKISKKENGKNVSFVEDISASNNVTISMAQFMAKDYQK